MFFDTETTGLPKCREPAHKLKDNWPHLVSIAWILVDSKLNILKKEYFIIKPNWEIHLESTKIHGITYEKAMKEGFDLKDVLDKFWNDLSKSSCLISHNINFDSNVLINAEMWDLQRKYPSFKKLYCTMELSKNILQIPSYYGYKSPKLIELYEYILKKSPKKEDLHNSLHDTEYLVEIVQQSKELQYMLGFNVIENITTNGIQKGILYI